MKWQRVTRRVQVVLTCEQWTCLPYCCTERIEQGDINIPKDYCRLCEHTIFNEALRIMDCYTPVMLS